MKISTDFILTNEQIDELQNELIDLHVRIREVRAEMKPLQDEIKLANDQWNGAVQPLLLRARQLAGEISRRQATEVSSETSDGGKDRPQERDQGADPDSVRGKEEAAQISSQPISAQPKSVRGRKDADQKEQFLQFLLWILDDQSDTKSQMLMSTLTEMGDKGSVQLADMLERMVDDLLDLALIDDQDALGVPKVPAWTIHWFYEQHTAEEQKRLLLWYDRLSTWHEALKQRFEDLTQAEANQRKSDDYARWCQYHQGPDVWKSYLANQRAQAQRLVERYEVRLRSMSDMVGGTR
jgi:hypothetical protein